MINLLEFNNAGITAISVLIAVIGSFVTLTMNERIVHSVQTKMNMWLKAASLSLGLTAWTVHFIGITSLTLSVSFTYNISFIFISMILAVLTAYLAFTALYKLKKHWWTFTATSVLTGSGMAVMLYIGIMALQTDAQAQYNSSATLFSFLIAISSFFILLQLFSRFMYKRSFLLKLLAALLMATAIVSMHYSSVKSVFFHLPESVFTSSHFVTMPNFIILLVLLPIGIIFLFMVALSSLDRKTALHLAYTDDLTNLPNRRSLEQFIQARTTPLNLPIAVAIIDIDNFKWINETYGYESGNQLIIEFSRRLKQLTPQFGLAARIEGNKFALAVPGTFSCKEIQDLLSARFLLLKSSFPIFGEPLHITFSAGVVLAPEHGSNFNDLILNAERALRHVKHSGKNEVILYNTHFHDQDLERQLAMSFQKALENQEFYLCYQPKLNLHTGLADSVEALIRWESPVHGFVSPAIFIPIAEKNGFIFDLTKWILDEACRQMKQWESKNHTIKRVAINISAPMFLSDRLTQTVKQTLKRHGLSAHHVELEITETSIMEQFSNALSVIDELKKEGISLSLDDFGTGVSSLTYLKRLPIDQLKIDKSFIDDVHISAEAKALVEMIIQLAKLFGLTVTAEGVEKEEQLHILNNLGCDSIQGYFISRPERASVLSERYEQETITDVLTP